MLFPVHPVRVVREAAESVLGELGETLVEVARALDRGDVEAAEEALVRARRISSDWGRFEQALDLGREAARYAPTRRHQRQSFVAYREAGLPLDLLVRDVHVLARGVVRALTIGDLVPPQLTDALRDLARAICALGDRLGRPKAGAPVRSVALRAAYTATELAPPEENISASMLIGYTQATAADLLRALGLDRQRAHQKIGEAAEAARA